MNEHLNNHLDLLDRSVLRVDRIRSTRKVQQYKTGVLVEQKPPTKEKKVTPSLGEQYRVYSPKQETGVNNSDKPFTPVDPAVLSFHSFASKELSKQPPPTIMNTPVEIKSSDVENSIDVIKALSKLCASMVILAESDSISEKKHALNDYLMIIARAQQNTGAQGSRQAIDVLMSFATKHTDNIVEGLRHF